MQKLAALLMTSFLAAPAAFATWIAPVSTSICTRDFNAWGNASICECPHATRYENRIGQCVQGAPIEISVDGHIHPELNAEGEATAYILSKNEHETFKLVLPFRLRAKLDKPLFQAMKLRISGEVIENYDGSEIAQPTIIVEKIELIDLIIDDLLPAPSKLAIAK